MSRYARSRLSADARTRTPSALCACTVDGTDASLVIFARFDIRAGEEMCISYKGLPDDSEVLPELPPRVSPGGRRKHKTCVQAHVSPTAARQRKEGQCKWCVGRGGAGR